MKPRRIQMDRLTSEEFKKLFAITPLNINDCACITVKEFCELTNRSPDDIRWMINQGNKIRKLKSLKISGKNFIPIEELLEFPFAKNGRHSGGIRVERYYIEEGALKKKEEVYINEEK
jgi:hypothetical protein